MIENKLVHVVLHILQMNPILLGMHGRISGFDTSIQHLNLKTYHPEKSASKCFLFLNTIGNRLDRSAKCNVGPG